MKSLISLQTKETIYWAKNQNLWRIKCYVFTEIFPAVFQLGPPFWPARLMFCIIWFSRQKSSSSKRRFHWRILREIYSPEDKMKWRRLLVWILLNCNVFVIRYYLLTEDCRKAWNFKYQNLVFLFFTYAIILLFSPLCMVLEHSIVILQRWKRIYIYIYIYIYI